MAKKDNLEVAVQQPAQQPATLYNMVAYMKALASMEEVPADLEAAFEAECRTALEATADKIDAVHSIMFRFAAQAEAARGSAAGYEEVLAAEIEREQKRAGRYEGKLENLRRMIMEVGVMRGLYVGEGDKRKPAPLQGNVATFQFDLMPQCISEEGFDEALVPDEFKPGTVTVPESVWNTILALIDAIKDPGGLAKECTASARRQATITRKVDRKALLAALKQPCQKCNGTGEVEVKDPAQMSAAALESGAPSELINCYECKGSGKRKVPGAKLEVGRLKLVVK